MNAKKYLDQYAAFRSLKFNKDIYRIHFIENKDDVSEDIYMYHAPKGLYYVNRHGYISLFELIDYIQNGYCVAYNSEGKEIKEIIYEEWSYSDFSRHIKGLHLNEKKVIPLDYKTIPLLRIFKNITYDNISKKAKTSKTTLSRLENKFKPTMTLDVLQRILDSLGYELCVRKKEE